jgi:hypothetical protein
MHVLQVLGEEGLVPGLLSALCAADEVIRIAALRLVSCPDGMRTMFSFDENYRS